MVSVWYRDTVLRRLFLTFPNASSTGGPRFRGGVSVSADVYVPDIVREGVGSGVLPPGRHFHPLLDRGEAERTAAVAGQGPLTDGGAQPDVRLCVLNPDPVLLS